MKRYKSLDAVRGLCMLIMVGGHCLNWWLTPEDYWLYLFVESVLAPIGASGFLFTSGVVTDLSYKNKLLTENSNEFNSQKIRNKYIFRSLFLLMIALIYNTAIALMINDLTWIWAWFVLQTIAISLLIAWPLLKTSKIFRIILGIALLVGDQFILALLLPYKGQINFNGVLFHILYNPSDQYIILSFFTMFLLGTVLGDILHDINLTDNQNNWNFALKRNFILPVFIFGAFLMTFGIVFLFPSFLVHATFSSMIYSLGFILTFLSISIYIEEFEMTNLKKSYKFFYYYSYYSFTIFLAHNLLYFLFFRQLNVFTIWIALFPTMFFFTLLIRIVYKKCGSKASLKALIGELSNKLACKIEERKAIKIEKIQNLFIKK